LDGFRDVLAALFQAQTAGLKQCNASSVLCKLPTAGFRGIAYSIFHNEKPFMLIAENNIKATAAKSCAASTLLPVTTFVIWMGCVTIGALGMALPYQHPQSAKPKADITQAELLNVELSNDSESQAAPSALASSAVPLNAPAPVSPLLALANPAFALPMEMPVSPLISAQTNSIASATAPTVQTLTYGIGDGCQPAPVYPREAVRARQEGKVAVRFCVAENGVVLNAEAAKPSQWPLLNDEAVRTVRKRWHFRQGPSRVYEVTIRFELNKERGES
jgi:TonB family protein